MWHIYRLWPFPSTAHCNETDGAEFPTDPAVSPIFWTCQKRERMKPWLWIHWTPPGKSNRHLQKDVFFHFQVSTINKGHFWKDGFGKQVFFSSLKKSYTREYNLTPNTNKKSKVRSSLSLYPTLFLPILYSFLCTLTFIIFPSYIL